MNFRLVVVMLLMFALALAGCKKESTIPSVEPSASGTQLMSYEVPADSTVEEVYKIVYSAGKPLAEGIAKNFASGVSEAIGEDIPVNVSYVEDLYTPDPAGQTWPVLNVTMRFDSDALDFSEVTFMLALEVAASEKAGEYHFGGTVLDPLVDGVTNEALADLDRVMFAQTTGGNAVEVQVADGKVTIVE